MPGYSNWKSFASRSTLNVAIKTALAPLGIVEQELFVRLCRRTTAIADEVFVAEVICARGIQLDRRRNAKPGFEDTDLVDAGNEVGDRVPALVCRGVTEDIDIISARQNIRALAAGQRILPSPPVGSLYPLFPVNVSLPAPPMMFSMLASLSPVAPLLAPGSGDGRRLGTAIGQRDGKALPAAEV
jgi:hypothetical protein